MNVRKSHRAAGFVLKSLAYGESDLIITFYSREFGKMSGIAKGAKRSKKRFANVFEPFSQISMIFSRKSRDTLALVESCEIIDHYADIRADLEKTLAASYFIELTDAFSPEGKANERLFALLADFLDWLVREKVSDTAIRFFEMRLLQISGFEPALGACVRCRKPVANGEVYYFYPKEGGITCAACARPERYDQAVSAGAVRTLLLGRDMDMEKMKRVSMPESLAAESRCILCGFITYVLGKEVKSLKVLEQVRRYCP
ncbi:MAG: DNA repair protein RecO [Smithellaceae bacterium]|nr:DNA repair protein RecO [Syntrophaceae bacterium]MDD4240402.1 DNA repair protein RecO [Smithellaceae bacterium]NLX52093.1 DNA repair protein RecO [Deltaproteobacteria bacterium]